ncbi:MAG: major capsid protein, partial [Treponema sp.]|nr:major capsid protein [Treponema sp.]
MDFLKKVLRMFTQGRGVPVRGFLSSFFRTTEEDYTEAEYVEIDVERNTEAVAPTLSDARTGAIIVNEEVWTENKYRPPYSAMKDPINLHELMERQPGETDDADSVGTWFGRLVRKITRILTKYHRMFARNIEL